MRLKPNPDYADLHKYFINTLSDFGLVQLVEEPTRGVNTLDLIISNCPQLIPRIEVMPGLSDHDTVFCEIAVHSQMRKQNPRQIPLYAKADWEGLKTTMTDLHEKMKAQESTASTEELWTLFRDHLKAAIKDHIPHKQARVKENKPWVSPALRRLIKKRDRIFKKMRKQGTEELKQKNKQLRREVQRQLRRAYWNYLSKTFEEDDSQQSTKSKRFWTYIKHQKSSNVGVAPLKVNGHLVSDEKEQAEALNQQFQRAFSEGRSYTEEEFAAKCEMPPSQFPVLDSLGITEPGVTKLLQALKPGKAPGPDGITTKILKELAEEISPILTIIFQSSLDTGTLPSDWKDANVTPIFKKGEHYDPANYRPVSLTSVCCKVLEHILTSNIMDHLELHGTLCHQQHGFRRKRSCETQLLGFADELVNNMAQGKQTDILVMDFAKAFDKVNHSLLVHKLHHYGIRGMLLTWISDFLRDRRQAVVVNGIRSDFIKVQSGVPQGSVLGPCLFLIYINDLPDLLTAHARLFADDTAVYDVVASPDDQAHLQRNLNQLAAWEKRWDMVFHPGKCTTLPVTRSRKSLPQPQYQLHGHTLDTVSNVKYLGLTFTKDLSWNEHINNVCSKANKTLGFLRRNLRIGSRGIKETAYKTLVRPIMEYAATVWDPHTQDSTDKIEAIQRRAARFVLRRYRNTSSASNLIDELRWPSLQDRRRTARLTMLYKIRHDMVCMSSLKEKMEPAVARQRRGHDSQYTLPRCRTQYLQQSFLPRTIKDWNNLPQSVVEATTIDTFVSRASKLNA